MSDMAERLNAALKGRYAIERELGEGGMATVYLADDLKHERKVAVKVLRPELAAVIGGERFIAEIKTTAALQHPHILPLFDSGAVDSFLYYVMPYVEGESLRTKLDRDRQLEIEEAVYIAKAVASALQYAHERDVIHRDIKPANVLLHAGEPVVADFGIALAISTAGAGRLTETGLSLGTPHYMSPEQASADRELNARSDVYSLSCVLYEMLTGQPPHTGPTAQSVLVRILTEDPRPVSDARPTVPKHIRAVVLKGLEKLPADRFRSADEFKTALDDTSFTYERVEVTGPITGVSGTRTVATGAPTPAAAAKGTSGRWIHAAATVTLAAATVWLALGTRQAPRVATDAPVVSFVAIDSAGPVGDIEVGPDGTLVYQWNDRIHVRPAGALEATPLDGVESVTANGGIGLSPDGAWIVFPSTSGSVDELRKVQVGGGPIANVWSAEQGLALFPFWGDDGWIYFSAGESPVQLRRVPEVGGEAELLLEVTEGFVLQPHLLPGGRGLLYTRRNLGRGESRVMLYDLETRDTTEVVPDGFQASWSPTGHIVYAHDSGVLRAVPFDVERLEVTGAPAPVLDGLGMQGFGIRRPVVRYGLNRTGTLAFVTGVGSGRESGFVFSLVDEDGNREELPIEPTDHPDVKISHDGRSLAYTRADDIWIFDLDRGSDVPLTEGASGQHSPIWSPDDTRIVYTSDNDLMVRAVDRASEPEPVTSSDQPDAPAEWLADGTIIVYTFGQNPDLIAVSIDDDQPARPLLDANWEESAPSISPDGGWLVYTSARSGTRQLYVRSWPELEAETLVSEGEGSVTEFSFPQWSPDGGTLYYQSGDQILAARVRTDDGFEVLSTRTLPVQVTRFLLDIHPDGRLLITDLAGANPGSGSDAAVPQLIVSTNWFTELRERLGN